MTVVALVALVVSLVGLALTFGGPHLAADPALQHLRLGSAR